VIDFFGLGMFNCRAFLTSFFDLRAFGDFSSHNLNENLDFLSNFHYHSSSFPPLSLSLI
jgi:hypothetical protein